MPDDFRVLGSFAVVESGLAHKSLQAMPLDSITSLSDDSRVQIRRATAQLRKAAAGENLKDATDAAELLGLICSRVAEPVDAEELLDRLLERRPSLDGAWDIRFTLASCQSAVNADRLLAACRKRLQYNDSSRNRWKLAMVYDAAHMPDEAVHVLEQGLQKEPNDYLSNVFLAVILMKRNGPYEQVKVRQAIDRALKEVQKKVPPDPDTVLECFVLEVAHFALSAQYESLYMWLDLAERKGWNDERILKLRKIVGPPILLPPPGIGAPPAKIGPQ